MAQKSSLSPRRSLILSLPENREFVSILSWPPQLSKTVKGLIFCPACKPRTLLQFHGCSQKTPRAKTKDFTCHQSSSQCFLAWVPQTPIPTGQCKDGQTTHLNIVETESQFREHRRFTQVSKETYT